jgi:hypothetical protein
MQNVLDTHSRNSYLQKYLAENHTSAAHNKVNLTAIWVNASN